MSKLMVVTQEFVDEVAVLRELHPDNSILTFLGEATVGGVVYAGAPEPYIGIRSPQQAPAPQRKKRR